MSDIPSIQQLTPYGTEERPLPPRKVSTNSTSIENSVLHGLHRALGPLAGGILLDVADFATLGPIGIVLGLFVGGAVGWWLSSLSQFSPSARLRWSVLAGLYCAIPFTGFLPLATIMSAVNRYYDCPADAPAER